MHTDVYTVGTSPKQYLYKFCMSTCVFRLISQTAGPILTRPSLAESRCNGMATFILEKINILLGFGQRKSRAQSFIHIPIGRYTQITYLTQ